LRRTVIAATCALLIVQQTSIVLGLGGVPLLPGWVSWPTPYGTAVLDFTSQGIGFDRPPDPPSNDYPTAVVRYLEQRSRGRGGTVSRTIALTETEPYINGNTLTYLAEVRGDPFTFVDVPAQPADRLRETLSRYDFVLYVPTPPVDAHIMAVNAAYAQGEMTPQILADFPHIATFPSAPGEQVSILDRLP
jgi:hypothetical protein